LLHRAPDARLIPINLWERDRGRYLRNLGVPASPEKYIARLEVQLEAGLSRLANAIEAGEASLDAKGVKLPKRLPGIKDPEVEQARQSVSDAFGHRQLCDIMVDIDRQTRFSWLLLGRPARSETELITLYTALLASGSNLSIADLARMIPSINAEALGQMVARLEIPRRMRAANDEVVKFMRQHRVAGLWGSGVDASADMVSLDATRHLWNARLDPKRKGPVIGTYPLTASHDWSSGAASMEWQGLGLQSKITGILPLTPLNNMAQPREVTRYMTRASASENYCEPFISATIWAIQPSGMGY
jgi:hypothetical protein